MGANINIYTGQTIFLDVSKNKINNMYIIFVTVKQLLI